MFTKFLVKNGLIDEGKFRRRVRNNIRLGTPRLIAVRRTIRDMLRSGEIEKTQVSKALDALVQEKQIPPKTIQNIKRLLQET